MSRVAMHKELVRVLPIIGLVTVACGSATTASTQAPLSSSAATTIATTVPAPSPTLTALEGLPRTGSYGFLDVILTAAEIGNVDPNTYLRQERESSTETYLFLTLELVNRADTDAANWPPSPYGLLIDGAALPAPEMLDGRRHIGLGPNSEDDAVLAYPVPQGTSFDQLAFTLTELDRIPLVIPLTREAPQDSFPVELEFVGEGPAQGDGIGCRQPLTVTAISAHVDIDLLDSEKFPSKYGSRRAIVGERFLTVSVRVFNNGGSICGGGATNIDDGDFRLVVDGIPQAPIVASATAIDPGAAKDLIYHFVYPTGVETLELEIGSVDRQVLSIPLDVSAVPSTEVGE